VLNKEWEALEVCWNTKTLLIYLLIVDTVFVSS